MSKNGVFILNAILLAAVLLTAARQLAAGPALPGSHCPASGTCPSYSGCMMQPQETYPICNNVSDFGGCCQYTKQPWLYVGTCSQNNQLCGEWSETNGQHVTADGQYYGTLACNGNSNTGMQQGTCISP